MTISLKDEIIGSLFGVRGRRAHPKKADVAKRTASNGWVCDSVEEKEHCEKLLLMQRAGEIRNLEHHPKFDLRLKGVDGKELHVAWFTPDFMFVDKIKDRVRVHEVKGWKRSKKTGKLLPRVNREFGIKKKLLFICYALEVELV